MSMHPRDAVLRIQELDQLLMDPAVVSSQDRLRDVSRERSKLVPIVDAWDALSQARLELKGTKELMEDPEFSEMAQEEHDELVVKVDKLQTELRFALIPPDPYEGRDILVEIRAGTGGDEAGLFAGDLFRMYVRYCDVRGWKTDVISRSEVTVGSGGGKGV